MVVLIVWWSSHPASDQGDVGSNPTQGTYSFPHTLSSVEFPITIYIYIYLCIKAKQISNIFDWSFYYYLVSYNTAGVLRELPLAG